MTKSLFAGILAAPLAVAALAAPAGADRAEDDLQLVRKAVASEPSRAEAAPTPRKGSPSWFRVRIVEKGARRAKVSVSLPLPIVRTFGDDWSIDGMGHCRKDRRCPTLGEILRALDSGQSLVEIEDDEASVRVWVE
jgi:hypothetical protein